MSVLAVEVCALARRRRWHCEGLKSRRSFYGRPMLLSP